MKKMFKMLFLFLIFTGCSSAQTKMPTNVEKSIYSDKFTISIGEEFFNSFLSQIGEIKGEQKIEIPKFLKLIKVEENIKWCLKNMTIDIEKEGAILSGTAIVEAEGEVIESTFKSKVKLEYDNVSEKIKFTPDELRLKKLANIDITNFYSPSFELKVSNPFNKEIKFKMADGTDKTINIQTNAIIKTEKDRVEITMKYIN